MCDKFNQKSSKRVCTNSISRSIKLHNNFSPRFDIPTVNFLVGGVGNSKASNDEFKKIQLENNLILKPKKITLKKIFKMCVPYGVLKIFNKV